MNFRKATQEDISAVTAIFDGIHTLEEQEPTVGWIRGVYPTRQTALDALKRQDLFVQEAEGKVVGVAVINQIQVDVYENAPWKYPAPAEKVMVLHTLSIAPWERGRGYGTAFARFYEEYAKEQGCPYLRIDTNAKNHKARRLYAKLGYEEIDVVPCVLNGIEGVQLVLMEKCLK